MIPNLLAGQNAIITGATRGLGAAIARIFWDAGASLLLVARSADGLREISADLSERPGQRVVVAATDLRGSRAADSVVDDARRVFDRLDVLVNNAAVQGPIGPAWQNDWASWMETLQVDLVAPIALCRLCVPWMAGQRRGKIVNISGGGSAGARPGFSAYATAKAGLVRFTETLAEEVRPLGIEANCVAPGALGGAMAQAIAQAGSETAGLREYEQAMKALGEGEAALSRAAALCLFLSSSRSDGVTGKLISAVWDPWEALPLHVADLASSDLYTLRRIVPKDRGLTWEDS